jgi:hypothetical protein
MKCETCEADIETILCSNCGAAIISLGPYCYLCGTGIGRKEEEMEEDGIDFSDRILCSDGTCIGVIDEKGLCKVCGKPYMPESD